MEEKVHYANVCRQTYTNKQRVERLTEEVSHDWDKTSSESEEKTHHIKEIKKEEEKKTKLYGNSENKRDKERVYN